MADNRQESGDLMLRSGNSTFLVNGQVIQPVYLNRTWNTTTVNQMLGLPGMFSTFNKTELLVLRGLAIASSAISILAAIVGLLYIMGIDKRRRVFRHHLIFFLISCDFLKALVLLIYPIIMLVKNNIYGIPAFYNTLGWLSAFAIEGADFAIAIFAIHFALLIFMPSWKWQNKSTGNIEGGLYRVRHALYYFTFLLPMVLASLAFVDFNVFIPINLNDRVVLDNDNYGFAYQAHKGGYKALSAWCYLPPFPLWYRLVLSWGPRYFIMVFILSIYVSIYIFVSKENRKIKNQIGSFRHRDSVDIHRVRDSMGRLLTLQQRLVIYSKYFSRKLGITKAVNSIGNFFFLSLEDYKDDELLASNDSEREFAEIQDIGNSGTLESDYYATQNSQNTQNNQRNQRKASTRPKRQARYSYSNLMRQQRMRRGSSMASLQTAKRNSSSLKRHSIAESVAGDIFLVNNPIDPVYHPLAYKRTQSQNWNTHSSDFIMHARPGLTANSLRSNSVPSLPHMAMGSKSSFANSGRQKSTTLSPVRSVVSDDNEIVRQRNPDAIKFRQHSQNDPLHPIGNSDSLDIVVLNTDHIVGVKQNFQSETYQEFKKRRAQIRKQLRSIFIYPFSYILIWTFPLAVDAVQYRYEIVHGPVVWLEYIATFMQPLSCFVDVVVFLYRERPWQHSWASITRKQLFSTYSLKGRIGEQQIRELCYSEMGRKGWYYRGRWLKLGCWRYKPQRWKRIAWFLYRFVKGFIKNDYNFNDNCYDATYWEEYYTGNKPSESGGSSNLRCSEALKEVLDVNNTRKDSYFSSSTGENLYESAGFVKVPLRYRLLHYLPMMEGVDLDELNFQLRTAHGSDNFEIPGMSLAMGSIGKAKSGSPAPSTFFKPDYNMTNHTFAGISRAAETQPVPEKPLKSKSVSSSFSQNSQSPGHSLCHEGLPEKKHRSSVLSDSKARSADDPSSEKIDEDQDNNVKSSGKMDLMDFLKG